MASRSSNRWKQQRGLFSASSNSSSSSTMEVDEEKDHPYVGMTLFYDLKFKKETECQLSQKIIKATFYRAVIVTALIAKYWDLDENQKQQLLDNLCSRFFDYWLEALCIDASSPLDAKFWLENFIKKHHPEIEGLKTNVIVKLWIYIVFNELRKMGQSLAPNKQTYLPLCMIDMIDDTFQDTLCKLVSLVHKYPPEDKQIVEYQKLSVQFKEKIMGQLDHELIRKNVGIISEKIRRYDQTIDEAPSATI